MSDGLLKLNCLLFPYLNDHPLIQQPFYVTIAKNESVHDLWKLIKGETAVTLGNVDASRLILWKVSIPLDDGFEELLRGNPFDHAQELLPIDGLIGVFPDMPRKRSLHILVQLPSSADTIRDLVSVKAAWGPDEQRLSYAKTIAPMSPSTQALPATFSKIQDNAAKALRWDRPRSTGVTIPVTLLHPIFGQFLHDCQNHEPTRADNALVFDLSVAMPTFFEEARERSRAKMFRTVMREHGLDIETSDFCAEYPETLIFQADGDMRIGNHRFLIIDAKNEIGGTSTEPFCKGIINYLRSTERNLEGAHISFSGAVWDNERPNYQVLSPALPLFWHHTDTDMRVLAARHFGALRNAIESLQQCYERFLNTGVVDYLQPSFPYPHHYTSLETNTEHHFTYLVRLEDTSLIFIAETDTNKQKICVKFVRRYSKEAHVKCAEMGIAPPLRGFEVRPGGWHMVVMDAIDDAYICLANAHRDVYSTGKQDVKDKLRYKLGLLHQAGLVHGDVRATNIMVRKDGTHEFLLVDFDWAGAIGDAKYPINVYSGRDLWRPEGAYDGQLISADHDIAMLNHIFS